MSSTDVARSAMSIRSLTRDESIMAYRKNLVFDLGYTHVFYEDAEIENTINLVSSSIAPLGTFTSTLVGEFESASVDVVGAQLRCIKPNSGASTRSPQFAPMHWGNSNSSKCVSTLPKLTFICCGSSGRDTTIAWCYLREVDTHLVLNVISVEINYNLLDVTGSHGTRPA